MKFLKYLFLVITFLGFLSTNLDAKVILIEDEKEISFSEEGFKEQTKESKWLGLLYLKEEFNSQSQSSFSKYPLRSLFQNFSGEVCSKNRAFKHKTRKVELVDEDALDGFVTKLSDDAVGDVAKKKDLVDALSLDNVSAEEFSVFGKLANDNPKLLTKEYFEEVRGILKHKDGEKLANSWKVLDNSGFSKALKTNPDNLNSIKKYLSASGDTPDDLAIIIKDATPDNQQKWIDVLDEIDFKVNTKVTGDFETKELRQALKLGKEQGGGILDFPNSAQGIEGVLKKANGQNLPISFKEITPSNIKNITREIKDNATSIRNAVSENTTNSLHARQYCKFDNLANTHINVNVKGSFNKGDFLEYFNSIPQNRQHLLFGQSGTFKEIKISFPDGEILFDASYKLVN